MTSARIVVGLVTLFAAAGAAEAQEKKAAPPAAAAAAPAPPKMSDEGRKFLDAWLGTWTSKDATLTAGDQKMTGNLKVACEKVSNGWGSLCKATFAFKGMPPMTNTFLMGWNLGTGEAHMFEVSDAGEVHDHSGKWTDDKSVSLVHVGKTPDGKEEKDACTATWNAPKELKFDCTGSQGGATVWTFTSTAKK
jgi:hypothetical protein